MHRQDVRSSICNSIKITEGTVKYIVIILVGNINLKLINLCNKRGNIQYNDNNHRVYMKDLALFSFSSNLCHFLKSLSDLIRNLSHQTGPTECSQSR